MAGKQKMVRHLAEQVVRQYRYVQKVPRPRTTIMLLVPTICSACRSPAAEGSPGP